jgi:hypothetical protein
LTIHFFGWASLLTGGGDSWVEYRDDKLVDESADPLAEFYRFGCPKYYEMPDEAMLMSSYNQTAMAQTPLLALPPDVPGFFQAPPHALYRPYPSLTRTENFLNLVRTASYVAW